MSDSNAISLGVGNEILTIFAPSGGSDRIDINQLVGTGYTYTYESPVGQVKIERGLGRPERNYFDPVLDLGPECILKIEIEVDGTSLFPCLDFVPDKELHKGLVGFVGEMFWDGVLRLNPKYFVPWRSLKIRRQFVDLAL